MIRANGPDPLDTHRLAQQKMGVAVFALCIWQGAFNMAGVPPRDGMNVVQHGDLPECQRYNS